MNPTISPSSLPLTAKHLALISYEHLEDIETKEKHRKSVESNMSRLSIQSTLSEFISMKTSALIAQIDELRASRDGINSIPQGLMDSRLSEAFSKIIQELAAKSKELDIIKQNKRWVAQEMEDQLESEVAGSLLESSYTDDGQSPDALLSPGSAASSCCDTEMVSKVYAEIILQRVVGGYGKQRGFKSHDQYKFSKAVLERYNAFESVDGKNFKWCHATGRMWPANDVKCAHLVPSCMSNDEIAMLFGDQVLKSVLLDPLNGLTLHKNIEVAYDTARISIVPTRVPIIEGMVTEWKCLLVDETERDKMACSYGAEYFYWRDLDGKKLKFRTVNRPARRFLYFRFLATYIYAVRKGLTHFTDRVERSTDFWGTPGEYIEKSALNLLAQNAGVKLPRSFNQHTFDGGLSVQEQEEQELIAPVVADQFLVANEESDQRWENHIRSEAGEEEFDDSSEREFGDDVDSWSRDQWHH